MNKFIKGIISVSLSLIGVCLTAQFKGSALLKEESELAADIQRKVFSSYTGKTAKKKIKDIRKKIKSNEERIRKLENQKVSLESKIAARNSLCSEMIGEIEDCPYYNCPQCTELSHRIKVAKNDVENLKVSLENQEYQLKSAKKKREKLDNQLAILLQNQELSKLNFQQV